MNYKGTIIEESLENANVLREVKILSTKVEEVTEEHKTPWIKQWTLNAVEIHEDQADGVAEKISRAWTASTLGMPISKTTLLTM